MTWIEEDKLHAASIAVSSQSKAVPAKKETFSTNCPDPIELELFLLSLAKAELRD